MKKKVIFLDIDGVLNSRKYDQQRKTIKDGNIDETRLVLLSQLVKDTGAVIVLSSTWRKGWDKQSSLCSPSALYINETLAKYGIGVYDKTPVISATNRDVEIKAWLEAHKDEVGEFVILDDILFGWGDLSPHLVRTDYYVGYGLEESHVEKAEKILSGVLDDEDEENEDAVY